MTGKEKCEFLKKIRKTMAKENGITYVPRECHHEGECSGTCPLCESEAAELLAALKKNTQKGEEIQVDKEAIEFLEQISRTIDEFGCNHNQQEVFRSIPQGYFDEKPMNDGKRRKEEKQYDKSGIWNDVKRKIHDFFIPPTTLGFFED